MRLRHVGPVERECFERTERQRAIWNPRCKRGPRYQQVQTSPKAQLGNPEAVTKPRWQAVARKKHVIGLGNAVFKTEIGVIKPGRDGHPTCAPLDFSCLVLQRLAL